jgi:hypothetical protein
MSSAEQPHVSEFATVVKGAKKHDVRIGNWLTADEENDCCECLIVEVCVASAIALWSPSSEGMIYAVRNWRPSIQLVQRRSIWVIADLTAKDRHREDCPGPCLG